MKQFAIDTIRNVCILGNGGAGKTSLTEAMIKFAGASDRLGTVADGTTVTDYDPEEIKRKISINTAVATFEFDGCKFNVLDAPGYFDFVGEALEAIRVAGAAVIVVSGKSGVSAGTEKAWDYCEAKGLPRILFINKIDDERADFAKVLEQLRTSFGKTVAPFQVPILQGEKIVGFVDVVGMRAKYFQDGPLRDAEIPAELNEEVEPVRNMIIESAVETDEALMERYFNGDTFSVQEIKKALRKGVENGDIVPVFCGSAAHNKGVGVLMEAIAHYLPSPAEVSGETDTDGRAVPLSDSGDFSALVFKTIADPFVGKLSIFKVITGSLNADSTVYNARTGSAEKIGKLYYLFGKKQIDTPMVKAGDIAAVAKLSSTKTGDTLCGVSKTFSYAGIPFPEPNLSMAVLPKTKGDEEKISAGLQKLLDEDATFRVFTNHETHQMLISGIGEMHLEIIKSKLKSKFGVEIDLVEPRVAYREKLKRKVKVEGKHKKQSGGHGQYGHVWIEFEPVEAEGLIFQEKIFGGAVPKNFFPAVEKGLQESITKGVLAGYPVVGLQATLLDGSYHPVDSSEMAFKVAASLAYKKAMEEGGTALLEPIGTLTVSVPSAQMGDIMGDITKRRGRVLGMNPGEKGMGSIEAEVPMAEMHKYATDLRSMTQGRGAFTLEFSRYEVAPPAVEAQVVAEAKKDA